MQVQTTNKAEQIIFEGYDGKKVHFVVQQLCLQVGYGQVGKTNNLYILMMVLVLNNSTFNQALRVVSPKTFVHLGVRDEGWT